MNLLMTKRERRRYLIERVWVNVVKFGFWCAAIAFTAYVIGKLGPGCQEPLGLALAGFVVIMLMGKFR